MDRKDQSNQSAGLKNKGKEEDWLLNAVVQTQIVEENGRWLVSLVFIDTNNPSRLLVKEIADYRSKRLAEIHALNMQRTAEKDPRGTQRVNKNDYDINNN